MPGAIILVEYDLVSLKLFTRSEIYAMGLSLKIIPLLRILMLVPLPPALRHVVFLLGLGPLALLIQALHNLTFNFLVECSLKFFPGLGLDMVHCFSCDEVRLA